MTIRGTLSNKKTKKGSKFSIWRHPWYLFTAPLCAAAPRLGTTALDTLDGPQLRAYAMYIHRREFYFGYFKTWDQFHQRLQAAFVLADT